MELRELPPDEFGRLAEFSPFDQGLPDPAHWRILCVEDEGRIIGFCGASDQVHWDPWYVDPAHQGKAAVFRLLLDAGLQIFRDANVGAVHVTVPDARPDLQLLVERFGFVEAPGKLYIFPVEGS